MNLQPGTLEHFISEFWAVTYVLTALKPPFSEEAQTNNVEKTHEKEN